MSVMLFHETREERLERELADMKTEIRNVRRGLFARHSELERKYQETYFELELLKSSIAKQDIKIWTSKSSISTSQRKRKTSQNGPELFTCIS